VIRPADATETGIAWRVALERRGGPTVLVLSRQKLPVLDRSRYGPAEGLERGAYVLAEADRPAGILIASGSEVHIALRARDLLAERGVAARVVNMASWELFEQQTEEYRTEVIPPAVVARVAIEAGIRQGWERYLGGGGRFVGMSTFGASAPGDVAYQRFGITAEQVVHELLEQIT
jgi:transketolase